MKKKRNIICPHPIKWISWDRTRSYCEICKDQFQLPEADCSYCKSHGLKTHVPHREWMAWPCGNFDCDNPGQKKSHINDISCSCRNGVDGVQVCACHFNEINQTVELPEELNDSVYTSTTLAVTINKIIRYLRSLEL